MTETLAAAVTELSFVTWDQDDPTGGNVYNQNLVAELRALGLDVRLHKLAGPWPEVDASTHAMLARALRAAPACLVDGIVASGSPEVINAAMESGHAVTPAKPPGRSRTPAPQVARRWRASDCFTRSARATSTPASR